MSERWDLVALGAVGALGLALCVVLLISYASAALERRRWQRRAAQEDRDWHEMLAAWDDSERRER